MERSRLVLAVRPGERFELRDMQTGDATEIHVYHRHDEWAVAFLAPESIRIKRIQWSGNGNKRTD